MPKSPVDDIQNVKPLESPKKPIAEAAKPVQVSDLQNGHTNGDVVEQAENKEETMFTFATIKIDDADLGKSPQLPTPTPPSTVGILVQFMAP